MRRIGTGGGAGEDQGKTRGRKKNSVVITDGFSRVIQTKKGLTEDGARKMQVSGRTELDAFGHTVKQYNPFTVDRIPNLLGTFQEAPELTGCTSTGYDVMDRSVETRQPLGVTIRMEYDIKMDDANRRCFHTMVTDPEGLFTHQFSDYEGRQVQIVDAGGGKTRMFYDNPGRLTETWDRK